MKPAGWITLFYGLIVIAGGVMGYVKAASAASLIMGSIFGVLLVISAIGMMRKRLFSAYFAILLTLFLDAFFAYRWMFSFKFMPSGLMSLLSLAVLLVVVLLVRQDKKGLYR